MIIEDENIWRDYLQIGHRDYVNIILKNLEIYGSRRRKTSVVFYLEMRSDMIERCSR